MKKALTALLLVFTCLLTLASSVQADDFELPAKNGLAFELETGKILYEKKAKRAVPVASISKILTTYMVYKEIKAGKLHWDTPVTISNYPYELTTNYNISNVPLDARKYTVRDLLKAMIVTNANSPAIALAEKIRGTEPKFVDKMKDQLSAWGITDAKLVNASGLPNEILGENIYPESSSEDENQLSAHDLAVISRHLLSEFPEVLDISKEASTSFANTSIFSYNHMLKGMPYHRPGVKGLFVGYSEKVGSSFLAVSQESNLTIISIVLSADGAPENPNAVFEASNQLLQHIASRFVKVTVLKKGQAQKLKALTVLDSPDNSVQIVPKTNLTLIKAADDQSKTSFQLTATTPERYAPIKKGEVLAKARLNDKHLIGKGYIGQTPQIELVANKDISRSFFLKIWWNHFVRFVNEKL